MCADLNVAMSLIALQQVPVVRHHPIVRYDRCVARGYGEVAPALIHRVTVGDDDGRWAHLLRKMATAVAEFAIDVLPATM